MDLSIVTFNKLFNYFDYRRLCYVDDVLKDQEIETLKQYGIIIQFADGQCALKRKALYKYAKLARENKDYDVSIFILNYLMSYNDKERYNWYPTYNYQLFKSYFLKGDYYDAYECLKIGFERESKFYGICVDIFDYILKAKKEIPLDDETYLLLANSDFDGILESYSNNLRKEDQSHLKILSLLVEQANKIKEDIYNKLMLLINEFKPDEIYQYTLEVEREKRSNESIRIISSISYIDKCLLEGKALMKEEIEEILSIFDLESTYNKKYKELISVLIGLTKELMMNSNYKEYLDNDVDAEVIVINNLSELKNELTLKEVYDSPDYIINTFRGRTKKIVVCSSNKEEDKGSSLAKVGKLFKAQDYQKCLSECFNYIINNGQDNPLMYNYASICYKKLGNDKLAKDFFGVYYVLQCDNKNGEEIFKDAEFYGLDNIKEVIDFARKYNISIELAGLNFNLSNEMINRINLFLSKYFYAVGDMENGDIYYERGNDEEDQNIVNRYLKDEINNLEAYKSIDYNDSYRYLKRLQLKK